MFHPAWPWSLHPHLVFEPLAWALGLALALRRARTPDVLDPITRRWVGVAALFGAAAGAKVLHWLIDPAATWAHRADPLYLLGGKTVVGGLLGGWAAVEAAKWTLGVTASTGDRYVTGLALGLAVGRVGCFLSGTADGTHGVPTALPWGIDHGDGVPRHPTALYEAAVGLALSTLPEGARPGARFRRFLALYLTFRVIVEPLKTQPVVALGLTTLQLASLAGLAALAVDHLRRAPETA